MSKLVLTLALIVALTAAAWAQSEEAPDTSMKAPATEAVKQAPAAMAPVSTLTLERSAFCTGVEEREPVGEATEFTTDVGTLYFWSNVLNSGDETSLSHVWYLNGEEKARVTLPAKYPRNRVWSSKIVPPEWDGEWKVEVVSADGDVLGAATCTVK